MDFPEFHYRWEWQLQAEPEALWPYVSDTNRFNRETGVPPVQERSAGSDDAPLANARRRLQIVRRGMLIAWEEQPFEWVRPQRFGISRRYQHGPMDVMRVLGELAPRAGGGTQLSYQVWARPKTPLGLIAIPVGIGALGAHAFGRAFRNYDRLAMRDSRNAHLQVAALTMPERSTQLSPSGQLRLQQARERLLATASKEDNSLVFRQLDRLIDVLSYDDETIVSHLRPYELADAWGAQRDEVLALCLYATRATMLNLQWDLLCPLCRGAKLTAPTLSGLPQHIHCEACHIDFTANLEHSVELTFRPSPAIREIDMQAYCVGGPQTTPHIVAQQLMPAETSRTISLPLEPGRYRARTLSIPGGQWFQAADMGHEELSLRMSEQGWPNDEQAVALQAAYVLQNSTSREQLLIIERAAWSDQSVTVADASLHHTFRDLFPMEVLRPGRQIEVGSLTVAFTDLLDSTHMYLTLGDAPAFDRVMKHFDVLREAIVAESGSITKTVGDAVMAAFHEPVSALRALLSAQRALAAQPTPLVLKVGMHHGPCIAVTLNDRLDYFGSTINIAARVQGLSAGGDVIVSDSVWRDPGVREWWRTAGPEQHLQAESIETTLKGIDGVFQVWRIRDHASGANVNGASN